MDPVLAFAATAQHPPARASGPPPDAVPARVATRTTRATLRDHARRTEWARAQLRRRKNLGGPDANRS